jgi:hypothetical protein
MDNELDAIRRALERQFRCTCSVTEEERPGGAPALAILYDTARLPPTWEAFVETDDAVRAAMRDCLVHELRIAAYAEIRIEHVARRPRQTWQPAGTDGVVAVDAPPSYFSRTGQAALFHQELHTGKKFRL